MLARHGLGLGRPVCPALPCADWLRARSDVFRITESVSVTFVSRLFVYRGENRMKTQQKNVSWRRRCALGGDRSVLPVAVLTAALSVVGCDSGGLGGLAGLLGAIPSAEEIESAGRQFEQFNVRGDHLPSRAVRIVNTTAVTAGINLVSGLTAPQPDAFLFDFGYFGEEAYLSTIDEQSVLIAPRGLATGTLPRGAAIGITASVPFAAVFFDFHSGFATGFG